MFENMFGRITSLQRLLDIYYQLLVFKIHSGLCPFSPLRSLCLPVLGPLVWVCELGLYKGACLTLSLGERELGEENSPTLEHWDPSSASLGLGIQPLVF